MARAKPNQSITISGVSVAPGQRAVIDLEVAQLYTHTPLSIPIEVINGVKEGPVVLVNAAIHGDELNGVEAVRQLLGRIDESKLKGTVVAVPVVNVFGLIHKSRYLPDRRDLNRCFPGSERGSIAGRLAYQFFNQVVKHCNYVIDLHTGAIHRSNLPQIRANLSNETTSEIAHAFGTPIIIDAVLRDGSLRAIAEEHSIPVITYEGGEALRFDPIPIAAAVEGVMRVMRLLGMLRKTRKKSPITPVIARSTSWVRAEQNGILRSQVSLGDRVDKGQVLAFISDPLGRSEVEVKAPREGIVIGIQTLPLVNEGDAIVHIAFFYAENRLVQETVETYIDEVMEQAGEELVMSSMLG